MRYEPKYILDLLYEKGHHYIGTYGRPKKVNILKTIVGSDNKIYICEISCNSKSQKICIKEYDDRINADVATLFKTQRKLENYIENFPVKMPKFLGYESDISAIIMEFIQGETLEKKITRSFLARKNSMESCNRILNVVAKGLALLNQIDYSKTALSNHNSKSNLSFVTTLKEAISKSTISKNYIQKISLELGCLLEMLSEQFWKRHEKSLVLGDFQPKNILISNSGEVYFIDIYYDIGHPLLNVSFFVSQLTRLKLRWILPKTKRIISNYQKIFLDQYFQHGNLSLIEDLPFFRVWSLMYSLTEHRNHRRILLPYLLKFYRSEMSKIISDLEEGSENYVFHKKDNRGF